MTQSTPHLPLYTILLVLTALLLSLFVLFQLLTTFSTAYIAAPQEISSFIDTVDFSIQENESYDANISKIQKLEDKLRLGRLLREIQKSGDDLREELNGLLIDEGGTRLRSSTRFLWANKRKRLEERVRRLDMLRMRFLVVYMGLIASKTPTADQTSPGRGGGDAEKSAAFQTPTRGGAARPNLQHALTEGIVKKPPLRRLATQAMGHNDHVGVPQRQGWMGVVAELQNSPLMHKRHASIERDMSSPKPPG